MKAVANRVRHCVARLDDLKVGEVLAVDVAGLDIALYRLADGLHATDNMCTHGGARLSDGFLEGCFIECPLHQGTFNVTTGAAARLPAEDPLATYAVEVEGGEIFILIEDGGS